MEELMTSNDMYRDREAICQTNIFDTAKYILEKCGGRLSTMKLQKLCYYAQAWSLVWNDEMLFPEDFQAWENGPVCPELFAKTKGKFFATVEDETGGTGKLTEEQKDTIDKVLEYYAPHDAQWLSRLSHLEEPWKLARQNTPEGGRCGNIITKESMSMYYGSL